jgi:hypothetical protein
MKHVSVTMETVEKKRHDDVQAIRNITEPQSIHPAP